MKNYYQISILVILLFTQSVLAQEWRVDDLAEWEDAAGNSMNVSLKKAVELGGIIDLMGNGALLLDKGVPDSLYALSENFKLTGEWTSKWKTFDESIKMRSLATDILIYGKPLDMTKGWIKFEHNPILSGGNTLLPLNEENITENTVLLPDPPGGVPQDQSILKGTGEWEGKWILFFNHTADAWPRDYYWSFAVADNLSPLKEGKNPFTIPEDYWPLFGPIDNHAPNDWIQVNGRYYAPDETHQSMSHLWISDDMVNWTDVGVIKDKVGHDPGITFDGVNFHLFSENGNTISHCYFDVDNVQTSENQDVLDVLDHTGDADVAYFNNQWHMFVDDGVHLDYKISYAATSPTDFPYEWKLVPEIYGPHNPESGHVWDDPTDDGNRFGTGDADIALEGTTLYLFTERPVGAAYKELEELLDGSNQTIEALVEVDSNDDGAADDSTGWHKLETGKTIWNWSASLKGKSFRIKFRFRTDNINESPLIRSFKIL